MAKKENKQAQGLENEVSNETKGTVTIQEIVARDLVIKEKNTYSNYDPEKEPEVQKGLQTLLELGVNPLIIAIGKFWNDRETWKQVRAMIAEEATKAGKTQADYEQNVLRPEYDKFTAIQAAVSRLNYAFNYMKPRESVAGKEVTQQIRIDGQIRVISVKKFVELKQTITDRNELKAALLENSTESKNVIEEF